MAQCKLTAAIKRGSAAVRKAYDQQRQFIEDRAAHRMADANTKLEKDRIKSEKKLAQLKLQRTAYDALAAVQREKEAVAQSKRAAGIVGWGEKASGFISRTRKSIDKLQGSPTRRPAKRKAATIRKRSVSRK